MPANPYIKQYLMTAGPTPLPPAVSQVQAEPILYHRAPAFIEVYARCLERLKHVVQTENEVLCFASSGSGGMESAVANLSGAGPALVASCGKFGERWVELNDAFGAQFTHLDAGWGNRVEPAELERALAENAGVKVVYTTLSETSTGVVNDVQALAEVAHAAGAIIVVDAVSGLGAVPCPQDEWGVDVIAAGSQKALMCPPGIALCSVSDRALERASSRPGGRYYFDFATTAKNQRQDPPNSPFTPPVSLLQAMDVALGMIEEEGLDDVLARHAILGRATRAGVHAMGLDLYGDPDERANVVTAVELPTTIDGGKVPKILRDSYGITANGGQGQLKGKIVRIAHTGYFGAFDIVVSLAGLEMTLAQLGHEVELGAGPGAAQQVFLEAGVAPTPA